MYGHLRWKAVCISLSRTSCAKMLPSPAWCPEWRSGSWKSGTFWLQEVCWREVFHWCGSLQSCAKKNRSLSRFFNINTGEWVSIFYYLHAPPHDFNNFLSYEFRNSYGQSVVDFWGGVILLLLLHLSPCCIGVARGVQWTICTPQPKVVLYKIFLLNYFFPQIREILFENLKSAPPRYNPDYATDLL